MGLELFLIGMFKKVVIADTVGVLFVDKAFSNPEIYSGGALTLASIMFSLQIYCDFSGYTDMAIGLSMLMGIELITNFNWPYFSTNFREFWQRWHISLSTWLRDYLYIPLGGNRKGKNRTYINLMTTMLLGGLWHGAQWTFVIWGGIHGILLCIEQILVKSFNIPLYLYMTNGKLNGAFSLLLKYCLGVFVFFSVTLIWIFFRSENITEAFIIISKIFTFQHGLSLSNHIVALLCIIGVLAIDVPQAIYKTHNLSSIMPKWLNNVYYASMLSAILMVPLQNEPFIYFRF